jgi:hypothetical protein
MDEDKKILEVFWHECGHLIMFILSNQEVQEFNFIRNSRYIGYNLTETYGGNITIPKDNIYSSIELENMCFKIINYFIGSIFQACINDRNALNLFENGINSDDSDYNCFINIIDTYKKQNNVNIKDLYPNYFNILQRIILSNQSIINLTKSKCLNFLEDYLNKDKPVKFSLNKNLLEETIADFKTLISSTHFDCEIIKLIKQMSLEITSLNNSK